MELSLPLVVDDEIDAKTEGALADDFDRTWDDDGLERAKSPEGVFFDLFNPRSQLKFFELGACEEGQLADVFD